MKKFYFIGLLGLSVFASAQTPTQNSKTGTATFNPKQTIEREVPSPVRELSYPTGSSHHQVYGKTQTGGTISTRVGSTMFITQTVNAIYRRTLAYADGKVSVAWTTSSDNGTNGYLSRGSGYNSFDGNTWAKNALSSPRIESFRTGYPCLAAGVDKEYLVSHRVDTSGQSQGLVMNVNTAIGSSTWATTGIFTPPAQTPSQLWPRAVVSGDYLVIIATYQDSTSTQPLWVTKNGVQSPMVYSRYKISTQTWVDQDKTLPGYDYDLFTEGLSDNYSMDANGNNISIVCGTYYSNLAFWKSTDNGATWTMKILDTFPTPHMRYDKDTFPWVALSNGSVHTIVDNAGKAHVFSGLARVKDSIIGDQSLTYTYSKVIGSTNDAIIYWSEYTPDSGLRVIANAVPLGGDSTIADGSFTNADRRYSISNSTWPSAGVDAQGRIFLVYSALTPTDLTTDGSNANYRDILVTYSTDNGTTWAPAQNATQHLGTNIEQIFPSAAKFVNDRLHISYLTKQLPGAAVTASNTDVFEINYLSIPVAQITGSTVGVAENTEKLFTINQNYPNPFHGETSIDLNFKRSCDATVTITDIMGKEILVEKYAKVPSGNSTIHINVGEIPAGVYLYTIEADGVKSTQRLMVN